ncbi:high frequency lysogenization protein HflD [Methyloterricola oryzae]|uniref:high frequency lysogenization protein HflD n=1 Tax=Methyloterricola oryzae TaxID=1495050 RepID=UPI0005EBCC67|nr:high frequency lysogenization protein HflD [Methyloterricola oryzae]
MIKTLTNQTIALAGLTLAVHLVQRIAKTGSAESEEMETALSGILKINADSVIDIYGGLDRLKTGLKRLDSQLGGSGGMDPELARYAASLIFLENKLQKRRDMQDKIRNGVERAATQAVHFGILHENVIANLADVYQETISQLQPRVMVMGEPVHLGNPANAHKIRALLLAGIRSAVLWRQCGGARWKLLFYRGKLQQETRRLLRSL